LRIDALIHAAAEGRVDVVEGRLAEFRSQNVLASERLATFAESTSIPFVHVSSNAVFGGRETPYDDWDTHDPINDYGRLKAEAESAVLSANASAVVVRPILMFGWAPSGARLNPVDAWVANLREGREIRVVDDVMTEPLYALDCARVIWRALEREIVGPVNVSGGESMTLYSLACQVADAFQLEPDLITAVSSNEFTDLAPRPRSTSFTLSRVRGELGFEPLTPSEGLRELQTNERP
jgi:dTDP-4-dehydrorhamnose reductase